MILDFFASWLKKYVHEESFPIKLVLRDRFILVTLIISLVINIGSWGAFVYYFKPQEEFLPLHYSVYFGIDYLGPWYEAYFLPLSFTIFLLLNLFLAVLFFRYGKIVSQILIGGVMFLHLFEILAVLNVIFLNF